MRASSLSAALSLVLALTPPQVAADTAAQQPLSAGSIARPRKRELTGRFLHITDFHPDPHYKAGASFVSGCHRKPGSKKDREGENGKGKSIADADAGESDQEGEQDQVEVSKSKGSGKDEEEDVAGYWGSAVTDCDSPMSLVNMTFGWLKKEWGNEVDFVIWTGDNARHDIDRSLPRTPKEITALNEMMVSQMRDTFGPDVVVVPSLGNNDIYPHNVMAAGPSSLTSSMLRVWKHYIPDDYDHVFERGAYYSVEVIPDRLAVISLNTLYWYDSNTLVDGCQDGSSDPGALEFDWLEVQLDEFRERGMQVWLSGHVPPHSGNYYDSCYLRYGDLALRYQDTIVGHLFGHMNIDHFFFLDVPELESRETAYLSTPLAQTNLENFSLPLTNRFEGPDLQHGPHHPSSGRYRVTGRNGNAALVDTLRKDFGDMPGPNKLKLKDYAVMNVAPSVIPTYLPAVRVYSYNITGVSRPADDFLASLFTSDSTNGNPDAPDVNTFGRHHGHHHGRKKPKYKCRDPANQDKPHCRFKTRPRYYNRTSPSRMNGPLTPLGYTQFYIPTLEVARNVTPEWQVEYSTLRVEYLLPSQGGWGQPVPVPLHLLPDWEEGVKESYPDVVARLREEHRDDDLEEEGETLDEAENQDEDAGDSSRSTPRSHRLDQESEDRSDEDEDSEVDEKLRRFKKSLKRITPWKMRDLTIGSYVKLARKLVAEKKMWKQFSDFMFVSADL